MRAMSGAPLALVAMLTMGTLVSSACSQVGAVQARRSFKAANAEYQAQNYARAAELYEEAIQHDPTLVEEVVDDIVKALNEAAAAPPSGAPSSARVWVTPDNRTQPRF